MQGNNTIARIGAARWIASIFGVLSGLGGFLHGIGEVLQGNVATEGIVINSWTVGPIATHMGGDPGMTVVPNMLATGILTLVASLAVMVWAAAFVGKKHGGWILLALVVAMLLVGGGFGPPMLGILAGVAGIGIRAPLTWWRTHLGANVRRFLARLWPWLFGVCAINGAFLVIGHVILVYLFGWSNPETFVHSLFLAVVLLLLSIVTGAAYDLQHREQRDERRERRL